MLQNIARISQNPSLSNLTTLQETPHVLQPQRSAGTLSEKKLHIFRRRRWTQLNHLVSSEVRIGEQDKSKNTGGHWGARNIELYLCSLPKLLVQL